MILGISAGKAGTPRHDTAQAFAYAITDANGNAIYDQADMQAASARYEKQGQPENSKIAMDIVQSGASVALFGEVHEFAPLEVIFETVKQAVQAKRKPVVALEWQNNLGKAALDDFQSNKIDAATFKTRFIEEVFASPYDEMKHKGFLADMAAYICDLIATGANIAFIDNRPPNMNDEEVEKNNSRDRAMADHIQALAKTRPDSLIIAHVGAKHSQKQNPATALGALLKSEMPQGSVLSLRFSPIVSGIKLKKEVVDFWAILNKDPFANWDYILPFQK